jgi:hypothetical protein
MVRFFTKIGTLSFPSTSTRDSIFYTGKIMQLIAEMKKCTEYQIDRNHHHCGIRGRLSLSLEYIQKFLKEGVCLDCWRDPATRDRAYTWSNVPLEGRGEWKMPFRVRTGPRREDERACMAQHRLEKALFTAEVRDWSPEEDFDVVEAKWGKVGIPSKTY